MPHPKRSLEQEERALANSYVEHSRRLNRSQAIAQQLNAVHPHFRHDFEPDTAEATLLQRLPVQRFSDAPKVRPKAKIIPMIDPKWHPSLKIHYDENAPIATYFRTRRRVTPR